MNEDFCKDDGLCPLSAASLQLQTFSPDSDGPLTFDGSSIRKPFCTMFKNMYNDLCTGADSEKIDEIVSVDKNVHACTDTNCIFSSSSICAGSMLLLSLSAFTMRCCSASH